MQIRFENSPKEVKGFSTEELREQFLIQQLIRPDQVELVYSHYDRMIVGGVHPIKQTISLPNHPELRAAYFLERRELGIINVGGPGSVMADGEVFVLQKLDALYLGKGTREVQFTSSDAGNPAVFYLLSAPAHHTYPNARCSKKKRHLCSWAMHPPQTNAPFINTFMLMVCKAASW
ncbi:MAG: hypothetical protein NVV59_19275 [Chitinophagaceae bacterium]|nr:hypothetical protein [Chitinophagaceae bacterium]